MIKPAKIMRGKAVEVTTPDGEVYSFESVTDAAKQMEIHKNTLSSALSGRYACGHEYPRGYHWRYK